MFDFAGRRPFEIPLVVIDTETTGLMPQMGHVREGRCRERGMSAEGDAVFRAVTPRGMPQTGAW